MVDRSNVGQSGVEGAAAPRTAVPTLRPSGWAFAAVEAAFRRLPRTFHADRWLPAAAGWITGSLAREIEAGRGFLWLPVLYGIGIVAYFALPMEPWMPALVAMAAAALVAAVLGRRHLVLGPALIAAAAIACGLAAMKLRTDWVAAPTLSAADVLTVSGWVESREQVGRTGARLIVRVAAMEGFGTEGRPFRIRVTAQTGADWAGVGDGVTMLASLRPPQGPVIPGGYSFGQADFYERIGASGFTYGAPRSLEIGPPPFPLNLAKPIQDLRRAIGDRIVTSLPGEAGQIARALITGERGGIGDDTDQALRVSGLAHILSISGLHMALVFAFVFGVLRGLFALSATLALRHPIKKWAASAALVVVGAYFLLSGASVPSQRAFIMLAVMSGAVLFDQRAFSIRNIVLAALVVILFTPEAVITASFQMSFAATLALIAGYEAVTERNRRLDTATASSVFTRVRNWAGGIVLTSLLAGLATTPFSAFHFQRTAPLALAANILAAVPVSFAMFFAIGVIVAMPFGLEAWPLLAMGWMIDAVNWIAVTATEWSGDAGLVRLGPPSALIAVSIGFLWLCLWRERWRLLGIVPILLGPALLLTAPRPDILVNAAATAVAVRGEDGAYRILGGRGASYEVETWLRSDADSRLADDPTLVDQVFCDELGCTAELAGGGRVALSLSFASLGDDCRLAEIVVTSATVSGACPAAVVIDGARLARYGVHALFLETPTEEVSGPTYRVETGFPETRRAFMPPAPQP